MKKHITTCRLANKTEHDSNKSSASRGEICRNTDDGEHTELHMGLQLQTVGDSKGQMSQVFKEMKKVEGEVVD